MTGGKGENAPEKNVGPKRRSKLGVAAAIVSAVLGGAFLLWLYLGTVLLVVREERVNLPHLDPADDGLRVAVLSDPHFGPGDAGRAAKIADMINRMDPDIIVLLGDFVNGVPDRRQSLSMEDLAAFVRRLRAKRGIFAVTGNHELWYGRDTVEAALLEGGATVLGNRSVKIATPSGRPLQIVGLPDYTTQDFPDKFPAVAPGIPTLILMHDPNSAGFVPRELEGFCIAGHTHGGQLRLYPGGGDRSSLRLLAQRVKDKLGLLPDALRPYVLFDRWFTDFHGRRIFITAGAGSARLGVRVFCPPEVVLLRFYSADPDAARQRYTIPEEL